MLATSTETHLKPSQTSGVLSYIDVTNPITDDPKDPNTQCRSVHNSEEMEELRVNKCRTHFAQAEGTTFTQEPLKSLL